MSDGRSRSRLPAPCPGPLAAPLLAVVLLFLAALGTLAAGPARAQTPPPESSCANTYDATPIVHPDRTRWIYLNCSGPLYPSAVTIDQPAHGTVTQGTTLSYTYTPEPGYAGGPDHFTLHPTGTGTTWPAVDYDVTVSSTLDTPPVCSAHDAPIGVRAGASHAFGLGSCLDDEEDPLTFEISAQLLHGTLGAVVSGPNNTAQVTYTAPADGYVGPDSFAYRARDDFGQASTAWNVVWIDVTAADANHPPFCWRPLDQDPSAPFYRPVHGVTTLSSGCGDTDGDPLSYTITTPPAHGTVTVDAAHGMFTYVPDPAYAGPESWGFTVDDGHGGIFSATHTIQVALGHDPVCADLALEVPVGGSVTTTLPCTDGDGDEIIAEAVQQPAHGTLTFDDRPHLHLTYTPAAGFSGVDTATIRAHDQHGGNAPTPRTITITVGHPAKLPGTFAPERHKAPTQAQQAAALLGAAGSPLGLGFGTDAIGYLVRGSVRPGQTAGVLFCRRACSVQIDGRLVMPARRGKAGRAAGVATARGLVLRRRTLHIGAGRAGSFAVVLSRAQRAQLAKARRGHVVLTLAATVGRQRHTVRRTVTLRP